MVTPSTFEVLKRELTRAADLVSSCVTARRGMRALSAPLRRAVSNPTPSQVPSPSLSGSWHGLFESAESMSPSATAGKSWILRISLSCDTTHTSASSHESFYAWAVYVEANLNRLSLDIQRCLL
jgi:hypothetical protein